MKKINEEKGAITILVLITMLFFLIFLVATYVFVSNKANLQLESTKQVKNIYDEDAEEIYNSYFSNEGIVPIYTVEQLQKIGSNEHILINQNGGRYYDFSTTATYILMNSLSFESSEWTVENLENINFEWNNNKITLNGQEYPVDYSYIVENLRERQIIGETETLKEETLERIYNAQKETELSVDCFTVGKETINATSYDYVMYLYYPVYEQTYVDGDIVAGYNARKTKFELLNNLCDRNADAVT